MNKTKISVSLAPFDAADYLRDAVAMAEFLSAALEDRNPDVFLQALRTAARARGMSQLTRDTGLGLQSLHKALAPGANPGYDTMLRLVQALSVRLHAAAA